MSPAKKKTSVKKKIASKTASKKVPAKKVTTKKVTKKQSGKKKTVTKVKSGTVSPEQRWKMIAEAAYLKAEKRGFASGHELEDWTAAENEIDRLLSGKSPESGK